MSRASLLNLSSLLGLLAVCSSAHALTFASWKSVHFDAGQLADPILSAPAADPDGDGMSNLAEYFFSGDPLFIDSGLSPLGGLADNHLTITYRERSDLSGAQVWLQGGDNLTHWATFNAAEEISRVPGPGAEPEYSEVTLRDPLPLSPKRFLRLRLLVTPLPALEAPVSFALTVENEIRVVLRWSDLNIAETGYAVEKLNPVDQKWSRKITLGPDQITWIDTQLDGYDGVSYRVVTLAPGGDLASDSARLADADFNTLPDAWELRHFGYTGVDLYADPNGNGVSNWLEYLEGTDPNFDFYQGVIPILEVVSGSDGQDAVPGGFLPLPLKVRVLRPDLSAWPEAPVRFVATSEEGLLANEPLSTARLAPALTVYTDADGYAQVWLKCP